ncbi:MAG: tRNA (guanosine(46)-N7)-methyltransferase TrmB [Thermodesulfovibrio sp.]|uniref:tRNA (guanosine(46)-N7)-methyltransferase TrmB n=1 Tax=unclassified Thermodesulfovibrio TaxID=2645936 RepID=UPI00083B8859|nr:MULTISPECIES: tRNA (guanosine(46)-N7)-methyltransferase TrmB [unclassified Thermodesulfovibrio]MDI6714617.1 tRNA (guanosine(46)-N7)-methyltransferase TrmB [Thermodesulfovibrio sp.]ODA44310.1 tRNA (guanine46-N7-)-methyltransferase [Thermodesulfovibrio sp. N1]
MKNYIHYRKTKRPLDFENMTVEIGFGSGDFLVKMAKENPEEIFFGIEKSWIPVNKLLKKCRIENLNNVFCTKLDAYWAMFLLFRNRSVKKIFMNYPDPWFKKSHVERRLTKRENLYIYAKKLITNGEIKIRTDDYSFLEFTLEEANILNCFTINVSNPVISEPLTKYEKKWLLMDKKIWDIILRKEKEPSQMKINEIKEVTELYPVKISVDRVNIEVLHQREFKIDDSLYLKCFSVWTKEQDYAIEVLISENNFLQSFILTIKKKDNYFIMDVSQFSEVLKTEGIQKALNFLAKYLNKEIL